MAEPSRSNDEAGPERQTHLSAEEARGGQVILRTRTMRIIFIAGLAGFALVAIILSLSA